MTKPRCNQVCLDATPYYHCVARCVRRAFLCGEDHFSGKSFEHRRQWIVDKVAELANIYAIDICAYAVMSNHYHLVIHINQQKALSWTADEVIKRWTKIFKPSFIIQRYLKNETLSKDEKRVIDKNVRVWRNRLYDLSWFMRCLNESEDKCTGRFWPLLRIPAFAALKHPYSSEGRYKSQALLDEAALLTCMSRCFSR